MQTVDYSQTSAPQPIPAPVTETERLLVVGDAAVPTGLARVIQSLLGPLREQFEIHHWGINYRDEPHDYPWKLYPAAMKEGVFDPGPLADLIETLRPGLLFLVADLWVLGDYLEGLAKRAEEPLGIVLYCPIEAGPVEPRLLRRVASADRLVLYTDYARREVESALARLRQEEPELAFPSLDVLAHGVDTETFFPLHRGLEEGYGPEVRAEIREQVYLREDLRDAFIVLNANRNQPRKRIDISIQGFALFARDKPANVRLHLHMGMRDLGWDIPSLAKRYGIADRLLLTTGSASMPQISSEDLNLLYNACDVGLSTSNAEGWGLVSFEHAATGAAQVVPGFAAPGELWRGHAELLPAALTGVQPHTGFDEGVIAPEEVAAALERLYRDRGRLEELSRAAFGYAHRPEFQWGHLAARLGGLFTGAL